MFWLLVARSICYALTRVLIDRVLAMEYLMQGDARISTYHIVSILENFVLPAIVEQHPYHGCTST